MFKRLSDWFETNERRLRRSFGDDISTPELRRQAMWHFNLFDHAFLRVPWTNFDKVAEDVYRSNHPGPKRLLRYKEMGIRAVLNLRGADGYSPWLFEQEACEELGLELRVAKIYARKAAKRHEIVRLIDTMREMPKPFVMHCKSGADRAGFAAVLYKAIIEGVPLEDARKHLAVKYIHFDWTDTGIVDHIIDMYELRNAASPIDMETWFRTEYDHRVAGKSFRAKQAGKDWKAKMALPKPAEPTPSD
ncbi:tyrosine-protein phosphatase [Aliiruegeria sabulilitoris]|uniref:tyrosine-protein phosphatase n=1 Tax=Aliiruegeria sabulilitoris TaxID=1510458 RepID=UPI0008354D84|nr:tyrosine-protein phosphatase [Aliiruegeria sabulilitoris]NDR59131.1 protein tyrosine phosphatase [Pseudoruegeria sp. M32A2M]